MKFQQVRLSNQDRKHLDRAKKIASTSTCACKHGAVVVHGGRVIGVGVNSYSNDIHMYDHIPQNAWSVHAEIAALRSIKKDLHGAVMYAARVNNQGEERMSKPCVMCQIALKEAGIKRVVYTVDSSMEL